MSKMTGLYIVTGIMTTVISVTVNTAERISPQKIFSDASNFNGLFSITLNKFSILKKVFYPLVDKSA